MSTSKVTVIAGPTAVGKGTVIARLRERFPQVELAAEDEFDVTVVNDDLETAVEELAQIMGLE